MTGESGERRVKIAFVNPQGNFDRHDSCLTEHPDFGGQLVYVKEVALALGRLGVAVDILTRRIDDPDWPGFSEPVDDFGVLTDSVRIVRVPFGGPRFLPKESLWPHLEEFADGIQSFYSGSMPDYATAHYADAGYACVLLRRRSGPRFTFTGHSLGAQKLDKLGVTRDNWPAMQKRYRFSERIAAERLSMASADTIITSTDSERRQQYAHRLYRGAADPGDSERFRVIPPGINARIFNTDSSNDDPAAYRAIEARIDHPDQPHVVVSSRLDAKKNIAAVIEAFAGSSALSDRARLALFVRGLDDPWSQLHRLRSEERAVLRPILERIDAAGLQQRVTFLNAGSQRELATAYRLFARAGSVFALPSLFEPFGLAPIEAAACGLAIAATANGGPSEIFADGAGLLFDPERPGDIAAKLLTALDRHEQLVSRATRRVRERYTWEKTAERYLDEIRTNLTAPAAPLATGALDADDLVSRYLNRP
jgi:sucrose-phosphate synthase